VGFGSRIFGFYSFLIPFRFAVFEVTASSDNSLVGFQIFVLRFLRGSISDRRLLFSGPFRTTGFFSHQMIGGSLQATVHLRTISVVLLFRSNDRKFILHKVYKAHVF
jgi:hypothetical protein